MSRIRNYKVKDVLMGFMNKIRGDFNYYRLKKNAVYLMIAIYYILAMVITIVR